jgi:hypothetical protein
MIYPAKVLVAWAEAIGGNAAIRDWLLRNGYKELGLVCIRQCTCKTTRAIG